MSRDELNAAYEGLDASIRAFWVKRPSEHPTPDELQELALWLVIESIRELYCDFSPYLSDHHLERSRVFEEYPVLRQYHDDDGLLSLNTPGLTATDQGFFYQNHVLHCHQFLRRYFTSNPNFDFLRLLAAHHYTYSQNSVSVAVDHTRLLPRKWASAIGEKDYWHGRPFAWEDIDDPHCVGLTVHGHPSGKPLDPDPLDRTEFFWSYRDGVKTFQVEEIRPVDAQQREISGHMPNRYIHSRRSSGKFVHLDGAVKLYDSLEYPVRHSEHMPNIMKSRYIKLFRIDGIIPDEEWSDLVAFFFRQNELVLEYLSRHSVVASDASTPADGTSASPPSRRH